MRILYFCQLFYPALSGGGEHIFYHWAEELTKQGHEIFVVCQNLRGSPSIEVFNDIKIYRVGSHLDLANPLPIGILSSTSFLLSSIAKGLEICRANRIDIIHSNTYIPAFPAQVCASILSIPHIATIHDVYYTSNKLFWKEWSTQRGATSGMKILGPLMEKAVCKIPAKKFHTVSNTSKSDILALGVPEAKIEVLPNGIDVHSYEMHDIVRKPHQAIYVGRLVFYKNINTIIAAFEEVVKKIPDATLVIAGNGPERVFLEEKAKSLGSNIIFTGNISEVEKIKLLSESAMLLNPSTIEGFGIVVLEGFACRRPVLISKIEPLTDLVEDSVDGFAIEALDSKEWEEKIMYLMLNPDKADLMGCAGHNKVFCKYSLFEVATQLVRLYSTMKPIEQPNNTKN